MNLNIPYRAVLAYAEEVRREAIEEIEGEIHTLERRLATLRDTLRIARQEPRGQLDKPHTRRVEVTHE